MIILLLSFSFSFFPSYSYEFTSLTYFNSEGIQCHFSLSFGFPLGF
jgi:hypothetical protein